MVQKKQANINILVELDENKIPEKLIWSAPDGGVKNKISKAIFLSIWDHKNRESLSIDLSVSDSTSDTSTGSGSAFLNRSTSLKRRLMSPSLFFASLFIRLTVFFNLLRSFLASASAFRNCRKEGISLIRCSDRKRFLCSLTN